MLTPTSAQDPISSQYASPEWHNVLTPSQPRFGSLNDPLNNNFASILDSIARRHSPNSAANRMIPENAFWDSTREFTIAGSEEKSFDEPEHDYVEGQFDFQDLYIRLQQARFESTQESVVHSHTDTDTPNHDSPHNTQHSSRSAIRALDWTGIIVPITNKFIGSGGFGDVFEGEWNLEALDLPEQVPRVAVKRFKVSSALNHDTKARVRLLREIAVWHILKHDNIVPFVGVCCSQTGYPSLISEWMYNGDVKNYINNHTPSVCLLSIVLGILRGLQYLHDCDPKIVHGDLKADNILINRRGYPCLCDFGLSRVLVDNSLWNTSAKAASGTVRWQAPELLLETQPTVTIASDVYAFGMTCYEVMTDRVPFYKYTTDSQVILAIWKKEELERPDSTCITDSFWALLKSCSSFEASERPDTSQILDILGSHTCGRKVEECGCLFRDISANTQEDD